MGNYNFLGINDKSNLNIELITKLKTAETTSKLQPIENKLNSLNNEKVVLNDLKSKLDDLLEAVSFLDMDNKINAFDNLTANVTGDSVSIKANSNNQNIQEGLFNITVNKLAQKDVFQSELINDKTTVITTEDTNININGNDINLKNKTWEQLATEIDGLSGVYASLQQVNNSQVRLVLKSEQTGLDNAIKINTDSSLIGFSNNGNHLLTSQNSDVDIDGINYSFSTNNIKLENGLEVNSNKLGSSNVQISRNNSLIPETINNFISKYNELTEFINSKTYNNEMSDKSFAREIMNQIKEKLFGNNNKDSIFTIGVNLNKEGLLELDRNVFDKKLNNDLDKIKNIFTNTKNTGISDKLGETIKSFYQMNGSFYLYEKRNSDGLTISNKELSKVKEDLDRKYNELSSQFSSYNSIISQMNSSFSSLASIIEYNYRKD